ncbi:MAG: hypothetical protein IKW74_04380, partial [Thermoguttaceae bacterium]|nr:hypothetical protein [Thermoguttaceae bacterium]
MSEKSGISMYIRLQIAFLFQFAIWGSWNVVLGGYPGIQGVGLAYSAFALGALFAPLIGSIVDTRLAAQKMLCILHFIGGAALIACGLICVNVGIGNTLPKWPVLILILLHGLAYMPSLPLINAVVFK